MSAPTDPREQIAQRDEQYYVGVRTRVPMQELDSVIPPCVDEAAAWLATRGIEATGAPLVRYHVIDMDTDLDITVA
ncbi:hypothetical protein ACO0LV_01570 [Pseudactinotalea sp. Z1739]|uniref:hypothetical protein n=1 Tax=Pseudactinotalea sp. Z1739 TaxID=3413028 RepID=UPI003C7C86B5